MDQENRVTQAERDRGRIIELLEEICAKLGVGAAQHIAKKPAGKAPARKKAKK